MISVPKLEVVQSNRFIKLSDLTDHDGQAQSSFALSNFIWGGTKSLKIFQLEFMPSDIEVANPTYQYKLIFSNKGGTDPTHCSAGAGFVPFLRGVSAKFPAKEVLYLPFFFPGMYKLTILSAPTVGDNYNDYEYVAGLDLKAGDIIYHDGSTKNILLVQVDNPTSGSDCYDITSGIVTNKSIGMDGTGLEYELGNTGDVFLDFNAIIEKSSLGGNEESNYLYNWNFIDNLSAKNIKCISEASNRLIKDECAKATCKEKKIALIVDYAKRLKMYKDYIHPLDAQYNLDWIESIEDNVAKALNKICLEC